MSHVVLIFFLLCHHKEQRGYFLLYMYLGNTKYDLSAILPDRLTYVNNVYSAAGYDSKMSITTAYGTH